MPKTSALISLLLLTNFAYAHSRTNLCRRSFANKWFQGYLNLDLERTPGSVMDILWLDRDTPYGIRAYAYEVDRISCDEKNSLMIKAHSLTLKENLELKFKTDGSQNWQPGILICKTMHGCNWKMELECSRTQIEDLCRSAN